MIPSPEMGVPMGNGPAGGPIPPSSSANTVRGPAGAPAPPPGRSPGAPPPRPSERYPLGSRDRVRSPVNFDQPPSSTLIGRGLVRRVGGALVGALWPDPVNEWETSFPGNVTPGTFAWEPPALEVPGVSDTYIKPNGSVFEIEVIPAYDRWHPPVLPLVPPLELPHFVDDPLPAPLRVPLPVSPQEIPEPGRETRRDFRPLGYRELSVAVRPEPDGTVSIRGRLANRPDFAAAYPRYSDSKLGRRLMGFSMAVVNQTYGVYSELHDFAEVFAWSMYGQVGNRVVPAMVLTNGSILETMQGYVTGRFRLDAVGFVQDYAMNQLGDVVVGRVSRATDDVWRSAGLERPVGITADNGGLGQLGIGGHDVSSAWNEVSDRVRSWDVQRAQRVRSLWIR